jgi:DNA-binding response OmpR family regulator
MAKLVCVVDDDELVRAKLALDLKSQGYDTIEVDDSRRLTAILDSRPVDTVVLDLVMPERDGVEIIADIRKGWPNVRIVAVSGGGRVGPELYLRIARHMGADVCLPKPVTAERLKSAIG